MKYLLTIGLLMLALILVAAPVNQSTAFQAARNWAAKWAPQNSDFGTTAQVVPLQYKSATSLYLFKTANGFVLTSADDAVKPILAYGFDTTANDITENSSFQGFIASRQEEIDQILSGQTNNQETASEWNALLTNSYQRDETRSINPLVTTRWNQGWPYNMYCPADAAGPGGHVYVGCVATAMAQVMKYWNWPVTGVGSHSYYASGYGNQNANFGQTTYDWASMRDNVNEPNEAVALLSYHCGVAVDMGYSVDGSGAYSEEVVSSWIQNFRYSSTTQLKSKNNYSTSQWEQMLRDELDNVRPVYYHGFGPAGGHAFVCDGYQGTNFFHFNWGWGGSYDGYFYTGNLNPGYTFNNGQGAIFEAYPLNYSISSMQMSLQGSDCSVGDTEQISLVSYPLLPDWNVASMSFCIEYDHTAMSFSGFNTTGTMLEGSSLTVTETTPGTINCTVTRSTALAGGGILLKANFLPLLPGNFVFVLASVQLNTTEVTQLSSATVNVNAQINDLQYSQIDILNALHINLNEVASLALTTSFVLPSWNVTTASFQLNYPTDLVNFEGFDLTGCQVENALVEATPVSPGVISMQIGFSGILAGDGDLINLLFRAIGNTATVGLATITVTDFRFNQTLIQNLQPGYIVLIPVVANDDNNAVTVQPDLKVGPNPFRVSADLAITLPKANQPVSVNIYNAKGQHVRTLYNSVSKGTNLSLAWDGKDDGAEPAPAGIYLLKLNTAGFNHTRKLVKVN